MVIHIVGDVGCDGHLMSHSNRVIEGNTRYLKSRATLMLEMSLGPGIQIRWVCGW
jgi:hypothetical protein